MQEIRDIARNTLIKIIETLGPRYLHYVLKEMQTVLVKGYQVMFVLAQNVILYVSNIYIFIFLSTARFTC